MPLTSFPKSPKPTVKKLRFLLPSCSPAGMILRLPVDLPVPFNLQGSCGFLSQWHSLRELWEEVCRTQLPPTDGCRTCLDSEGISPPWRQSARDLAILHFNLFSSLSSIRQHFPHPDHLQKLSASRSPLVISLALLKTQLEGMLRRFPAPGFLSASPCLPSQWFPAI